MRYVNNLIPLNTNCDWGNGEIETLEFLGEESRLLDLYEDNSPSSLHRWNEECEFFSGTKNDFTTLDDIEGFSWSQTASSYNPDEL
jgi:hypothetical protein